MPRKQPKRTWTPAQMDVRPKPPPRRTALEIAFDEAEQPRRHPEGGERARTDSAARRGRRNGWHGNG